MFIYLFMKSFTHKYIQVHDDIMNRIPNHDGMNFALNRPVLVTSKATLGVDLGT